MSASIVSLVNQRLSCARLLLQDRNSARNPVHGKALEDACVFHLCCAYRHYVRELAGYYGVKFIAGIDNERAAAKALAQLDKHPAEIQELCHLREQPGSWLSRLLAHYELCWVLPAPPPVDNAIALTDLDRVPSDPLTPEQIAEACEHMQAIIERHRESSVEC